MTKRQKTKVESNILLLDVPKMILKKYKGIAPNEKLLPILSNQKMNAYLKEIGDLCEVDMHLQSNKKALKDNLSFNAFLNLADSNIVSILGFVCYFTPAN